MDEASRDVTATARPAEERAAAELRRRIERSAPESYWEENLVEGRRLAFARILDGIGSLAGRRLLAIGVTEAERSLLEERGARLRIASAWTETAPGQRRERASTNARPRERVASGTGAFDAAILCEALERLDAGERRRLLSRSEIANAGELWITIRLESRWNRLGIQAQLATGDPTELLREIHLETHHRLRHQETIRRRNSVLRLVRLSQEKPDPGDRSDVWTDHS